MNQWQTMFSSVASVFLVVGAGAFARGIGWLTEEADRTLVRLTIWMLYPCLILDTMAGNTALFSGSSIFIAPVIGYILPIIGFIAAYVTVKLPGNVLGLETAAQRSTFIITTGLFNYGYIPIPLTKQLFPGDSEVLSSLFLHNAGVDFAIWTVGVAILVGRRSAKGPPKESYVFIAAIVLAMILNYTGLWNRRPMWLGNSVAMLATMAIPLSLLLSGAMIADVWKEAQFRSAGSVIFGASFLRLMLLPIIFIAIAKVLPVSPSLKRVLVIQAAMPTALFPIVLSRHFGGDVSTSVRIAVATSIIGLATIPFWLWIGFRVIH